MSAAVSPTQVYSPAPLLEAYESHRAWYTALTRWFIQTGQRMSEIEPEPAPKPPAKPGRTITRWTDGKPMNWKAFRRKQSRQIADGYHAVIYGTLSKPCSVCGGTERVTIGMRQRRDDCATYDLCVQCWSAVESFPAYGIEEL